MPRKLNAVSWYTCRQVGRQRTSIPPSCLVRLVYKGGTVDCLLQPAGAAPSALCGVALGAGLHLGAQNLHHLLGLVIININPAGGDVHPLLGHLLRGGQQQRRQQRWWEPAEAQPRSNAVGRLGGTQQSCSASPCATAGFNVAVDLG